MTAAVIYGLANGNFGDNAAAIWALPWGKVSLIDLYAGLALFGAWVAVRETSWARIAPWWIALIILGNLAAGIYVVRALLHAADTTELLTGKDRVG